MGKVLVNLYKLKNLNCGLGQVALNMGKYMSQMPNAKDFTFIVPSDYVGYFGNDVGYAKHNMLKNFFPLFAKKYEVLHHIYQMSGHPFPKNIKNILTIHDLNFLFEKKNQSKRNKYLRKVQREVDRADAIVYISEFTKNISSKFLNISSSKIQQVIYNGVQIETEHEVEKPFFLPSGEFIFTIGQILRKKNFGVLIDFLKKISSPYNLIIAGKSTTGYANELRVKIKKEGLEDRIILPGTISESDKIYLYRHCKAFVFPSLYEGFGLPVIEAMRFGKPVFLSTSTSLPEIGGELAFYWEDFAPEHMVNIFEEKMRFLSSNPNYSEKLKKYSLKFKWEENVKAYNDLYKKIMK